MINSENLTKAGRTCIKQDRFSGDTMRVAVLTLELHLPEAGSLKAKRRILQGLIRRLRNRFNLSATEVKFQDYWQRSRLGLAIVCTGESAARRASQQILHHLEEKERFEVISYWIDLF